MQTYGQGAVGFLILVGWNVPNQSKAYSISYVKLAYPAVSDQRFPQTLWAFLVFSSSAINSVIYGILNRTFRIEILKIVSCKRGVDRAVENNITNRVL